MRFKARTVIALGMLVSLVLAPILPKLAEARGLKICLEEDSPPYSYKFGKKIGGFDYDLGQELAKRLKRSFAVQWFETENDEENIPKLEANALLSARLCHLIGNYPLMKSTLGAAPQGSFRLPDHAGQKRDERLKLIKLGVVTASTPYNRAVFAAIVGPEIAGEVKSLDDFKGVRIISEVATLPSVLLLRHGKGILIDNISHISPLKNLFEMMDAGKADATLIELHRFESYKFQNPGTKLRLAGYISPLGVNLGYAALQTSTDLLGDVNMALAEIAADGTLKAIAARNHMTLVAPQKPYIMDKLRLP